jgi:RecA-family ATPase
MSKFPLYIQRQLDQPPPAHPGRHDAWRDLSLQMVGEGIPDEVIFRTLRDWIPDRDKKDSDLRACIRGAHTKNPGKASGVNRSLAVWRPGQQEQSAKIKPHAFAGDRKALPSELLKTTPIQFLERLFDADTLICLSWARRGSDKPNENMVKPLSEWSSLYAHKPEGFSDSHGVWWVVNPMRAAGDDRGDDNVQDFRFCLLEADVPHANKRTKEEIEIEKEKQYAWFSSSGLPLEAIYDSAGKSVHAIVRIGASSIEEFKERVAKVYEYAATLPGLDGGRKACNQLSRLPGAYRGDDCQKLLSWSVGAPSFEEWEKNLPIDDGLPEIDSFNELEAELIEEPAELIKGILHKGSKMVIGSNSKGRKTMLLVDLGLSIASGTDWLEYETVKGRVLYINLELQKFFFRKRTHNIAKAKGLSSDRFSENFDSITLRGHAGDASQMIPAFVRKIGTRRYDAIIIDPTYKLMGANRDENATKDIASLLNEFEKLAVQTGAAVIFVSHFSKGNQAAKESIDRISGSGVFARDPDTIMTLTAHEEPDAMIVDFTLRNFPPVEQYTVKWNQNWLFERAGLDPKRAKKAAGRSAKYSAHQLLDVLSDGSMEDTEWRLACENQEGIKKDAFYSLRRELIRDKRVYKSPLDKKWTKAASESQK